MNALNLAELVNLLPPGRARTRYQRLAASLAGESVAVNLPYSDHPVWLVTGHLQAQVLVAQGIPRWRIWTLAEAQDFLGACGSSVRTLEQAALIFQSEHA